MSNEVVARDMGLFARVRRKVFASTRLLFPADPTIRRVKVGPVRLLVYVNEYLGRRLLLSRNFESEELALVGSQLRPGDVVFDIGANIGFMAMNFAHFVGPTGRVHAFEPIARNALLAQLSAELEGFRQVKVHQLAVSDAAGKRLSQVNTTDDSAAAYFSDTAGDDATAIETISVDAAAEDFGLPRVDFIKIDVEGYELDVLKGALGMLADPARRPRLLMIEIVEQYLTRAGASARGIYDLLARFGYRANLLENNRLRPIDPDETVPPGNVFFTVDEARR